VPAARALAAELAGAAQVDLQALRTKDPGRQPQRLGQPRPGPRIGLAGVDQQDAQRHFLREAGKLSVLHRRRSAVSLLGGERGRRPAPGIPWTDYHTGEQRRAGQPGPGRDDAQRARMPGSGGFMADLGSDSG
jgi:hypothetical protein